MPSTIITDHGCQFESRLWNVQPHNTSQYTALKNYCLPPSNQWHGQTFSPTILKTQPNLDAWMDTLATTHPSGYSNSTQEEITATPAEMVYSTTLRLPGEFVHPSPITSLPNPSDFISHTYLRAITPVSTHSTFCNRSSSEPLNGSTCVPSSCQEHLTLESGFHPS